MMTIVKKMIHSAYLKLKHRDGPHVPSFGAYTVPRGTACPFGLPPRKLKGGHVIEKG